ncbi:MAG: hypothetical protein A2138_20240 [Deltaproteobacteria bacterium RBG_16_71_12]|nr:MAG: hypothetical protein A2138_20240 [Deltaproteobacteria bacterium RBG_16_71_12]
MVSLVVLGGLSGFTALLAGCPAKVATVEVTPPKVSLRGENEQKTLVATPKDEDGAEIEGRQVTWTSSDTGIAVVDSTGKVKPAGSGTATITAKIDETTGTSSVTVQLLKGVRLEAPAIVIKVGTPRPALKVAFSNEKGEMIDVKDSKVEWKTADPNVATVGPDGVINGVNPGSTTITAKVDGLSADVAVTVNPAEAGSDAGPAPPDAGLKK